MESQQGCDPRRSKGVTEIGMKYHSIFASNRPKAKGKFERGSSIGVGNVSPVVCFNFKFFRFASREMHLKESPTCQEKHKRIQNTIKLSPDGGDSPGVRIFYGEWRSPHRFPLLHLLLEKNNGESRPGVARHISFHNSL